MEATKPATPTLDNSPELREPPKALESPYKGLVPYSEEDAAFFFGREVDQNLIIANLRIWRLTLFYGESGVGKSSVLQAGVVPALRIQAQRNLEEDGEPGLAVVAYNNWRDDPIAGLSQAVEAAVRSAWNGTRNFAPLPPSSSLERMLQVWSDRVRGDLFILLDQFEEYFLYHPNEDGPGTFGYEFARSVNQASLRVHFLVSIREDSLSKLDYFKGRISALFDNLFRLEHLDTEAGRETIVKPLQEYNRQLPVEKPPIAIEPELIDAVLSQVKTGQVALQESGLGSLALNSYLEERIETPYLQLVLTRLWEEEFLNGSQILRLDTLERLHGATQIVRTHLDKVMSELPTAERNIAAKIFQYLVTSSGTKIAYSAADVADLTQLDAAELTQVLEKLTQSGVRILRPVAPPPDSPHAEVRYEIFHDVLGAAILDWRRRYIAQQKLEAQLEQSKIQARQNRERLRKNTLSLLSFPFAFGPLLLVLGVLTFTSNANETYKNNAYQYMTQLDYSSAFAVSSFLDERGKNTQEIALHQTLITGDAATSRQLAQNLLNTYSYFSRLTVADAKGQVRIDYNLNSHFDAAKQITTKQISAGDLVGQNVSSQAWFKEAKNSLLWVDGPVSATVNSASTPSPTEMRYSAPIKDNQGNFLGIVNLRIPFYEVEQLLVAQPQFFGQFEGQTFNYTVMQSGLNFSVIDSSGRVIAPSSPPNSDFNQQLFKSIQHPELTASSNSFPSFDSSRFSTLSLGTFSYTDPRSSANYQDANYFYATYKEKPYDGSSVDWYIIIYSGVNFFYFQSIVTVINLVIATFIIGLALLGLFRLGIPRLVASLSKRDSVFSSNERPRWRVVGAIIVASILAEGLIFWFSLVLYSPALDGFFSFWGNLLFVVACILPTVFTTVSLIFSFRKSYAARKTRIVVVGSIFIDILLILVFFFIVYINFLKENLVGNLLALLALGLVPVLAILLAIRLFRYAGF